MNEGPGMGTSLYGNSARGTWKEGSFTGNPEGYKKESSGTGHLSPYGSSWEAGWGVPCRGTLRDST